MIIADSRGKINDFAHKTLRRAAFSLTKPQKRFILEQAVPRRRNIHTGAYSMKVAVIGSRGLTGIDISKMIPPDATMIISGGAAGVDTLAERYADERGIPKRIIRPDYGLYGKQAPLVRDRMIVELADAVVAIWDGVSTGTGYTISYAKSRGIPIQVYIR